MEIVPIPLSVLWASIWERQKHALVHAFMFYLLLSTSATRFTNHWQIGDNENRKKTEVSGERHILSFILQKIICSICTLSSNHMNFPLKKGHISAEICNFLWIRSIINIVELCKTNIPISSYSATYATRYIFHNDFKGTINYDSSVKKLIKINIFQNICTYINFI